MVGEVAGAVEGKDLMSESYFEQAQICLNGHVITLMLAMSPERSQSFCSECGSPTISECPECNAPIHGYHVSPGIIGGTSSERVPAFCHNCGTSYPWTAARLEAARELADDAEELDGDERDQLKKTLDDLVNDTPRTQVAAQRFKRLAARAGAETAGGLKEVLVGVVSEAARKVIWGV